MAEYVRLEDEVLKPAKKSVIPTSVVLPLFGINIVFFILQMAIPNFTGTFLMVSSEIYEKPWTLLTTMFLHGSLFHIFFNMYILLMFGSLLESKIGWKRFLALYLISGIIVSYVASFIYPAALGASGAIMAVIGTTIVLLPNLKILFFFVLPMSLWVAGVILFLIDFIGTFFPFSNIAHLAHIVGLFCGLAYGFYLRNQKKKFYKRFGGKKHVTVRDADEYSKLHR